MSSIPSDILLVHFVTFQANGKSTAKPYSAAKVALKKQSYLKAIVGAKSGHEAQVKRANLLKVFSMNGIDEEKLDSMFATVQELNDEAVGIVKAKPSPSKDAVAEQILVQVATAVSEGIKREVRPVATVNLTGQSAQDITQMAAQFGARSTQDALIQRCLNGVALKMFKGSSNASIRQLAKTSKIDKNQIDRSLNYEQLIQLMPMLLVHDYHGKGRNFFASHHVALMAAFDRAPPWVQEALQQPNGIVIVPEQLALPAPSAPAVPAPPAPPAPASEAAAAHGGGQASSAYGNFDDMHSALGEITEQG